MKNDFEMIVKKLPTDVEFANIYPLGDLHIGSPNFGYDLWYKWKTQVLNDPNGYVVIIGDLVDNGLKHSKTNSYSATMRPFEQKEWLKKELAPLKDKIIGAVRGNHEKRSINESDDCPLYDVMAKLDLEDLYREHMAFVKVSLGFKNKQRQWSYNLVLHHGGSANKVKNFSYSIDNMDVLITGHTHTPTTNFPSKIVIDPRNETVSMVGYIHVVVPSFQKAGGYTLEGMYLPQQDAGRIPIIKLKGTEKGVDMLWI